MPNAVTRFCNSLQHAGRDAGRGMRNAAQELSQRVHRRGANALAAIELHPVAGAVAAAADLLPLASVDERPLVLHARPVLSSVGYEAVGIVATFLPAKSRLALAQISKGFLLQSRIPNRWPPSPELPPLKEALAEARYFRDRQLKDLLTPYRYLCDVFNTLRAELVKHGSIGLPEPMNLKFLEAVFDAAGGSFDQVIGTATQRIEQLKEAVEKIAPLGEDHSCASIFGTMEHLERLSNKLALEVYSRLQSSDFTIACEFDYVSALGFLDSGALRAAGFADALGEIQVKIDGWLHNLSEFDQVPAARFVEIFKTLRKPLSEFLSFVDKLGDECGARAALADLRREVSGATAGFVLPRVPPETGVVLVSNETVSQSASMDSAESAHRRVHDGMQAEVSYYGNNRCDAVLVFGARRDKPVHIHIHAYNIHAPRSDGRLIAFSRGRTD